MAGESGPTPQTNKKKNKTKKKKKKNHSPSIFHGSAYFTRRPFFPRGFKRQRRRVERSGQRAAVRCDGGRIRMGEVQCIHDSDALLRGGQAKSRGTTGRCRLSCRCEQPHPVTLIPPDEQPQPQRSASVRIETRPSRSLRRHSYPHTCATIQTHADHQPRHTHSRSGRRHERSRVLRCRCCRWRIERRQQHLTGQSRCSTTTTHIHIPLTAKLGKKHGGFECSAGRVSSQSTSTANTAAAIRIRASTMRH